MHAKKVVGCEWTQCTNDRMKELKYLEIAYTKLEERKLTVTYHMERKKVIIDNHVKAQKHKKWTDYILTQKT